MFRKDKNNTNREQQLKIGPNQQTKKSRAALGEANLFKLGANALVSRTAEGLVDKNSEYYDIPLVGKKQAGQDQITEHGGGVVYRVESDQMFAAQNYTSRLIYPEDQERRAMSARVSVNTWFEGPILLRHEGVRVRYNRGDRQVLSKNYNPNRFKQNQLRGVCICCATGHQQNIQRITESRQQQLNEINKDCPTCNRNQKSPSNHSQSPLDVTESVTMQQKPSMEASLHSDHYKSLDVEFCQDYRREYSPSVGSADRNKLLHGLSPIMHQHESSLPRNNSKDFKLTVADCSNQVAQVSLQEYNNVAIDITDQSQLPIKTFIQFNKFSPTTIDLLETHKRLSKADSFADRTNSPSLNLNKSASKDSSFNLNLIPNAAVTINPKEKLSNIVGEGLLQTTTQSGIACMQAQPVHQGRPIKSGIDICEDFAEESFDQYKQWTPENCQNSGRPSVAALQNEAPLEEEFPVRVESPCSYKEQQSRNLSHSSQRDTYDQNALDNLKCCTEDMADKNKLPLMQNCYNNEYLTNLRPTSLDSQQHAIPLSKSYDRVIEENSQLQIVREEELSGQDSNQSSEIKQKLNMKVTKQKTQQEVSQENMAQTKIRKSLGAAFVQTQPTKKKKNTLMLPSSILENFKAQKTTSANLTPNGISNRQSLSEAKQAPKASTTVTNRNSIGVLPQEKNKVSSLIKKNGSASNFTTPKLKDSSRKERRPSAKQSTANPKKQKKKSEIRTDKVQPIVESSSSVPSQLVKNYDPSLNLKTPPSGPRKTTMGLKGDKNQNVPIAQIMIKLDQETIPERTSESDKDSKLERPLSSISQPNNLTHNHCTTPSKHEVKIPHLIQSNENGESRNMLADFDSVVKTERVKIKSNVGKLGAQQTLSNTTQTAVSVRKTNGRQAFESQSPSGSDRRLVSGGRATMPEKIPSHIQKLENLKHHGEQSQRQSVPQTSPKKVQSNQQDHFTYTDSAQKTEQLENVIIERLSFDALKNDSIKDTTEEFSQYFSDAPQSRKTPDSSEQQKPGKRRSKADRSKKDTNKQRKSRVKKQESKNKSLSPSKALGQIFNPVLCRPQERFELKKIRFTEPIDFGLKGPSVKRNLPIYNTRHQNIDFRILCVRPDQKVPSFVQINRDQAGNRVIECLGQQETTAEVQFGKYELKVVAVNLETLEENDEFRFDVEVHEGLEVVELPECYSQETELDREGEVMHLQLPKFKVQDEESKTDFDTRHLQYEIIEKSGKTVDTFIQVKTLSNGCKVVEIQTQDVPLSIDSRLDVYLKTKDLLTGETQCLPISLRVPKTPQKLVLQGEWSQNQLYNYHIGSKPLKIKMPKYAFNTNPSQVKSVDYKIICDKMSFLNKFAFVTMDTSGEKLLQIQTWDNSIKGLFNVKIIASETASKLVNEDAEIKINILDSVLSLQEPPNEYFLGKEIEYQPKGKQIKFSVPQFSIPTDNIIFTLKAIGQTASVPSFVRVQDGQIIIEGDRNPKKDLYELALESHDPVTDTKTSHPFSIKANRYSLKFNRLGFQSPVQFALGDKMYLPMPTYSQTPFESKLKYEIEVQSLTHGRTSQKTDKFVEIISQTKIDEQTGRRKKEPIIQLSGGDNSDKGSYKVTIIASAPNFDVINSEAVFFVEVIPTLRLKERPAEYDEVKILNVDQIYRFAFPKYDTKNRLTYSIANGAQPDEEVPSFIQLKQSRVTSPHIEIKCSHDSMPTREIYTILVTTSDIKNNIEDTQQLRLHFNIEPAIRLVKTEQKKMLVKYSINQGPLRIPLPEYATYMVKKQDLVFKLISVISQEEMAQSHVDKTTNSIVVQIDDSNLEEIHDLMIVASSADGKVRNDDVVVKLEISGQIKEKPEQVHSVTDDEGQKLEEISGDESDQDLVTDLQKDQKKMKRNTSSPILVPPQKKESNAHMIGEDPAGSISYIPQRDENDGELVCFSDKSPKDEQLSHQEIALYHQSNSIDQDMFQSGFYQSPSGQRRCTFAPNQNQADLQSVQIQPVFVKQPLLVSNDAQTEHLDDTASMIRQQDELRQLREETRNLQRKIQDVERQVQINSEAITQNQNNMSQMIQVAPLSGREQSPPQRFFTEDRSLQKQGQQYGETVGGSISHRENFENTSQDKNKLVYQFVDVNESQSIQHIYAERNQAKKEFTRRVEKMKARNAELEATLERLHQTNYMAQQSQQEMLLKQLLAQTTASQESQYLSQYIDKDNQLAELKEKLHSLKDLKENLKRQGMAIEAQQRKVDEENSIQMSKITAIALSNQDLSTQISQEIPEIESFLLQNEGLKHEVKLLEDQLAEMKQSSGKNKRKLHQLRVNGQDLEDKIREIKHGANQMKIELCGSTLLNNTQPIYDPLQMYRTPRQTYTGLSLPMLPLPSQQYSQQFQTPDFKQYQFNSSAMPQENWQNLAVQPRKSFNNTYVPKFNNQLLNDHNIESQKNSAKITSEQKSIVEANKNEPSRNKEDLTKVQKASTQHFYFKHLDPTDMPPAGCSSSQLHNVHHKRKSLERKGDFPQVYQNQSHINFNNHSNTGDCQNKVDLAGNGRSRKISNSRTTQPKVVNPPPVKPYKPQENDIFGVNQNEEPDDQIFKTTYSVFANREREVEKNPSGSKLVSLLQHSPPYRQNVSSKAFEIDKISSQRASLDSALSERAKQNRQFLNTQKARAALITAKDKPKNSQKMAKMVQSNNLNSVEHQQTSQFGQVRSDQRTYLPHYSRMPFQ